MAPLFQQPFMSGGFPSMNRAAAGVGGWVELGRTTLGSAGDTIDVTSLANKRYLMTLTDAVPTGGTINTRNRLNGDTGSNFSYRGSDNGDTDVTNTSFDALPDWFGTNSAPHFGVGYLANYASKEKLQIWHGVHQNTAGAGNAPTRREWVGKWANTSNAIDQFTLFNATGTGDFAIGSELVILGWDPADSHTNNFWEELADASWSSGGSISSGTFTAKKYLWIQGWHTNDSNATGYATLRVGNTTVDTGSNYANRYNQNAASENTGTSESVAYIYGSNTNASSMTGFFNTFIINNASNEKLMINHYVARGAAGAANAPDRWESVHKWANTSNQIDIVELLRSSNNFTAGQIKVWGSD